MTFATAARIAGRHTRTYVEEVLADSPAAYWHCGESSGSLSDSSGNSRTLTAAASPTYSVTSLVAGGDAAVNTTNGSFSRSDSTLAGYVSAWSLEAWVKRTATWSGENAAISTNYTGAKVTYALRTNGNRIQAAFWPNDGAGWKVAQSTFDLALNTTYHVVGTWDGTTLRLYINGTLDNSSTPGVSPGATTIVYLGRRGYADERLAADIDEPAIYPATLSAGRILAHYNAGT